ncbi:DUF4333 domain-containing protein [Curtobacterium sp. L1-20]|uniref:DUF4333 domain-containing protein n=1 Tax=Curtobacterium sp. L1-20 TaxID=3138181 RepID=UPI003B52E98B
MFGTTRGNPVQGAKRTTIGLAGIGLALVAGLGLTGCSVHASVNHTTTPAGLERVVADSLEKSVGQRPEVDCGDDAIDLEDGNVVHCDVNTKGYDVEYDATVKISDVDGAKYSVDVSVADTPKSE